ncbi:MAG: hypothetical protein HRU03_01110 [Nanoarchaeales archaeon]|nr:hypothetical protein [Nanoarchaeales archaeon]
MEIISNPVFYIKWIALWVAILTVAILTIDKERYKEHSKLVFMLFVIPVMASTLYLAGHTVYKNTISTTGGPIHWHADYQVWACGERLDLVDPIGMANKIGTPLFHEHNDDRIHVEGTVDDISNVNLAAFFRTVGGKLTETQITYPTEGGEIVDLKTGDNCNGEPAELKVYVNGIKINNVDSYMYYAHSMVPPGDCVIIDFNNNLEDTTQRICDFWAVEEWDYENFKDKRKLPNNEMVFKNENYEYIDGLGLVEVNR